MIQDYSYSILLVNGDDTQKHYIEHALPENTALKTAPTIHDISVNDTPDVLLYNSSMSTCADAIEFIRLLKIDGRLNSIPVAVISYPILIDVTGNVFSAGASDFLTKPFEKDIAKVRIKNLLEISLHRRKLSDLVEIKTRHISNIQEMLLTGIGSLIEFRHQDTGNHIKRTQKYVLLLANKLKNHHEFMSFLTDENIELLRLSAPLHDIGKINTPDSVLLKTEKLTDQDFEIIKKHPSLGSAIITSMAKGYETGNFLNCAKAVAEQHHEWWNGSERGYPNRLKGEGIHWAARIMALADVYDAARSARVYKASKSHNVVLKEIVDAKGTQFDPLVTDAFLHLEKEFEQLSDESNKSILNNDGDS